jgi:hypothetical protein
MRVAEDVDLVRRLTAAGWRVRYEPEATVAHEHPATTGEWLRRRTRYGTGAALLAARHAGAVSPLVLAPETALAWGLALSGRRAGRGAAAALLGVSAVRLSRGLARPGEQPPLGLAAALVLRGAGATGRWPCRPPWPRAGRAGGWSPPPSRTPSPAGGRTAAGWGRPVSPSPGGWRTSPTERGCGGAPLAPAHRGRCCRPAPRPDDERASGRCTLRRPE